jgi:hypothetical protein
MTPDCCTGDIDINVRCHDLFILLLLTGLITSAVVELNVINEETALAMISNSSATATSPSPCYDIVVQKLELSLQEWPDSAKSTPKMAAFASS